MNNLSQISIFNTNIKTLHDTSYDNNNNQYLTNSTYPAIDFDEVKNTYILANSTISTNIMRSNDALVILNPTNARILFIEFKNGDIHSNLEKEKIRTKIAESLLIFNDIVDVDLTFDRNSINYILVYNQANNPAFQNQRTNSLTQLATAIGNTANMSYLINGFDRYKAFFHDIKTINETEFAIIENQLQNNTYTF